MIAFHFGLLLNNIKWVRCLQNQAPQPTMKKQLVFKYHKQIYMRFSLSNQTLSATDAANAQSTQKLASDLQEYAECREGQLNVANMKRIRPLVDSNACFLRLQACTNINSLKQLHSHIHICGLEHNIFIGTKYS